MTECLLSHWIMLIYCQNEYHYNLHLAELFGALNAMIL